MLTPGATEIFLISRKATTAYGLSQEYFIYKAFVIRVDETSHSQSVE